jgi:nicotinamidase-related amidase
VKTALLVIDVQNGLVVDIHGGAAFLRRLRGLADRARKSRVPVVFVQDDEVARPGSRAWEVHPKLGVREGEPRVRKLASDSFHETPLRRLLGRLGVRRLVIGGCKTEYCVDSTVRRAGDLGFDVTVVADGHSTTGNGVLSAAEIIRHHNRVFEGFGIPVVRSRAVRF